MVPPKIWTGGFDFPEGRGKRLSGQTPGRKGNFSCLIGGAVAGRVALCEKAHAAMLDSCQRVGRPVYCQEVRTLA